MRILLRTLMLLCLSWCLPHAMRVARAQNISTGAVTITSMGCNTSGPAGTAGTACFLYVSGPAVGPAGCSSTSIRWDPTQSPNGQVTLAQLTAAFLAGQQVVFVLNNSCWAEWPAYPTIFYYQITGPPS